jgi:hypothetical protein
MIRTTSFLVVVCASAIAAAQSRPAASPQSQPAAPPQSQPAVPPQSQTPAPAEPEVTATAAPAEEEAPGPFVVGAGLGALFPQPFSELGTHVVFGLEVGYRLPFFGQRIEVKGDVGYSPPGNSVDISRTEGTYKAEVVSQQLYFSLGPRVRLMPSASRWNVTLALGPRIFLLRTTSNGSRDGEAFVEFTEQSTEVGLFAVLGGEYVLGPGSLFLDLNLAWSGLSHRITGDVSTGSLALTAGYRLFLPF